MKDRVPDPDLTLTLLPEPLAVCRLRSSEPIPGWALAGGFFSVTRTPEELSVVCLEQHLPAELAAPARMERGFLAFRVEGPLPFSLTDILARLLEPLAREGIPVLALSTFDTDYLLIRREQAERAAGVLERVCRISRA